MKKLIFLLIIVLFSSIAIAADEKVNLEKGESFVFRGKNLTILNFDTDGDNVIVCVNNKKAIIEDNQNKLVNGARITVLSVNRNDVRIKIDVSSRGECDESCSNFECIDTRECIRDSDCKDDNENTEDFCLDNTCINSIINEELPEGFSEETSNEIVKESTSKKSSLSSTASFTILIVAVIAILLIVYFLKKR